MGPHPPKPPAAGESLRLGARIRQLASASPGPRLPGVPCSVAVNQSGSGARFQPARVDVVRRFPRPIDPDPAGGLEYRAFQTDFPRCFHGSSQAASIEPKNPFAAGARLSHAPPVDVLLQLREGRPHAPHLRYVRVLHGSSRRQDRGMIRWQVVREARRERVLPAPGPQVIPPCCFPARARSRWAWPATGATGMRRRQNCFEGPVPSSATIC